MTQTQHTNPILRIRVKDTTNNWIGRVNDIQGELTQVNWLKDGNNDYTAITSWVPSDNLINLP